MRDRVDDYLNDIANISRELDAGAIIKIIGIFKDAHKKRKKIYVIGNGGSAATANHFACDLGKNATRKDNDRFAIISLCNDISCITAYGNDEGYETIFEEQLKNFLDKGDILFCISASGNSPNIIRAAEYAKNKKRTVVGLTGFKGGKLKDIADQNITVFSDSFEKIEDIHLVITHVTVYCFKQYLSEA